MIWIKLSLFLLVVFGLNIVIKLLLRKVLKIEKEKKSFLSYNHINDLHRKIDWGIRISTIFTILVTNMLVIVEDYPNWLLLIPIFWIGLDYPVRTFFEKKYLQNSKQYILTISEGVIMLFAIIVMVMQFNFFI